MSCIRMFNAVNRISSDLPFALSMDRVRRICFDLLSSLLEPILRLFFRFRGVDDAPFLTWLFPASNVAVNKIPN